VALLQTAVDSLRVKLQGACVAPQPYRPVRALALTPSAAAALPETQVPLSAAVQQLRHLGCHGAAQTLRWLPPDSVSLVGGAAGGCAPPPGASPPDVALRMPLACLRQKDYLDGRYHAARALYLERVRQAVAEAHWERAEEARDPRAPALLLPGPHPFTHLRLLVSLPPNAFPAAKLGPGRCNLRGGGAASCGPTPAYNASLLADCDLEAFAQRMRLAAASVPALPAASVLLGAWAQQRQLLGCADGCARSSLLLRALALTAHARGALQPGMSPHQAFRATLRLLGAGLLQQTTAKAPPDMRAAFPVVLLAPCGRLNYARCVSAQAATELTAEALCSAAQLDRGGRAACDAALLEAAPAQRRYHLHLRVGFAGSCQRAEESLAHAALGSCDVPPLRAQEARLHQVLTQALGARATRVRVAPRPICASPMAPLVCHVALHPDPQLAHRLVDSGPSAEDAPQAAAFRAFWGDKAELRRFADGAICEAVVWADVAQQQRHTIPARAAEWALRRHFPDIDACAWSSGCLDAALPEGPSGSALMAVLDRLGSRLRSLAALPLRVASLQPLSPALRGTAVAPPQAHALCGGAGGGARDDALLPACVDCLDVMVQLEGSGAWPEDAEAVEKTRAAFALAIAAELGSAFGIDSSCSERSVDVLFEGFAFRLHVTTEAEWRRGRDGGVAARAGHAAALAGACGAHPSLAPTVRLAHRWLSSQLLWPHFGAEAVELMVASLFLHPRATGCAPASREAGLLAFMALLAEGGATHAVDCGGAWGSEAREAAQQQAASAPQRPPLLLPTPDDPAGERWTRGAPCIVALSRAQALAAVCGRRLGDALLIGGGDDRPALLQALFRPSLKGFDCLVQLRRGALPAPQLCLCPAAQAPQKRVLWQQPPPAPGAPRPLRLAQLPPQLCVAGREASARQALLFAFHPLPLLLAQLRSRFGALLVPFADGLGGDVVALALRPNARLAAPALRLPRAACAQPASDGGVTLNLAELAAELGAAGMGLVTAVMVAETQQQGGATTQGHKTAGAKRGNAPQQTAASAPGKRTKRVR